MASTSTSIFIDYSGSTGGNTKYWNSVSELVEKEYQKDPNVKIVFWDHCSKPVDINQARGQISSTSGHGGTNPTCFVDQVTDNSDVIIVTDGQVNSDDVTNCDTKMNNKPLNSVHVHFINTGGSMNLSVSAPFTRNAKEYQLFENEDVLAMGSTNDTIDLSSYTDNPEKLILDHDELFKTITVQNVGRMNMDLRNRLLDLQKNLMNTIANRNDSKDMISTMREKLTNQTPEESIEIMKTFIHETSDTIAKKVQTCIASLCNQCNGSTNFSFDQLKDPARLMRAQNISQVAVEELPETENVNKYECPIMMDSDTPCLLINEGAPILEGLDKSYLNSLMTFPLILLNNKELVDKLKARIDHVCGLNATRVLFESGNPISPYTRNTLSSALSFGINSKSHDDANLYTLANLFFGTKLVGQKQFWLAVVYFVVKQIEYLNNPDLIKCFEEYLIYRLKNGITNITLTGLPVEPMMKTPCDIACWYSIHSPFILDCDDERNRLRSLGTSSKYIIELLNLMSYPVYDKVHYYMRLYRAFAYMMAQEKDNKPWRDLLRAQYQNSLTLSDGTIILLDGPVNHFSNDGNFPDAYNNLPKEYSGIHKDNLVKLSQLVDRTKTLGNIPLKEVYEGATASYEVVTNYGYPDNMTKEQARNPVELSPKTFRPYMVDPKQKKFWKKCSEEISGPLNKQLSGYNYYIDYVNSKNAYPDTEDFIKYVAEKQKNCERHIDTLPARAYDILDSVVQSYKIMLENVSVGKFICLTNISRSRKMRTEIDGSEEQLIPVEELM